MVEKAKVKIKESGRQPNLPLGALVKEQVLLDAGFNYSEPSLSLFRERDNGLFTVYISDEREGLNPNIVIIEDQKIQGEVRWKEWYFGTFQGTPLAQRRGDEEQQKYYSVIRSFIKPSNRVLGRELEERIKRFI